MIAYILILVALIAIGLKIRSVLKNSARNHNPVSSGSGPQRNLDADIESAARLFNWLRADGQITAEEHERFQRLLDNIPIVDLLPIQPRKLNAPPYDIPAATVATAGKGVAEDAEIVVAELVPAETLLPQSVADGSDLGGPMADAPIREPAGTAPWDMPDPPPRAPRRTLAEMFREFLQEKNIRWGELVSGILIVGSAIGLVVSLRNELEQTIPYFPALLFMLVTAAIHAAGTYTLKKWKLRNTSRGLLIIGLIMIPLNVLAACILTGSEELRRPLSDPYYWIAVSIGLLCYCFMTAWSSRQLFRRGYLAVTLAIMGCSITALIVNRIQFSEASSWPAFFPGMVAAIWVLAGTAFASNTVTRRRPLSVRRINRTWIILGLAAGAFACAIALILVRSPDRFIALTAVSPALTALSLLVTWTGFAIFSGSISKTEHGHRLAGLALAILGLTTALTSIVFTAPNTTLLAMNACVATVLLAAIARATSKRFLIPAAWCCCAVSVVSLTLLLGGQVGLDRRVDAAGLEQLYLSGKCALILVGLGCLLLGGSSFMRGRGGDQRSLMSFRAASWHRISALIIGIAGVLLAVAAGLLHRSNPMDTMTASAMLAVCSVVLLVSSVRLGIRGLPSVASLITLLSVAFSLLWNPIVSGWIDPVTFGLSAKWVWVACLSGLVIAVTGAIASARVIDQVSETAREFGWWAAASVAFAVAGALLFAHESTGFSGWVMFAAVAAMGCSAWSHRFDSSPPRLSAQGVFRNNRGVNWSTGFVLSTFIAIAVVLYENAAVAGLPSPNWIQHLLIQCAALSLWTAVWTCGSIAVGRHTRIGWIFNNQAVRGDHLALAVLAMAVLGVMVFGLYEATGREMAKSFVSQWHPDSLNSARSVFALAAVVLALFVSVLERGSPVKAAALVMFYLLAWAMNSIPFDAANSSGCAIRWLVGSGVLVASVAMFFRVPALKLYQAARLRLRIAPPPHLDKSGSFAARQVLVNLLLVVSVVVVLAISSIATAQLLLTEAGRDSLGGPIYPSFFGNMRAEISYGLPGGLITSAILLFAISQRRIFLAACGSAVYQYVVLFSVAMLFLSPHPAIATSRFIGILQAVSVGMSGYGFIWFWQRLRIGNRIDGNPAEAEVNRFNLLELHTLINLVMVSSLAILIGWRFFGAADPTSAWIDEAGGWIGVVALAAVTMLSILVFRVRAGGDQASFNALQSIGCWAGLVLVAMLAPTIESKVAGPLPGLRTFIWGSMAVGYGQIALIIWRSAKTVPTIGSKRSDVMVLPVCIAFSIAFLFALRGSQLDAGGYWQYLAAVVLVVVGLSAADMLTGKTPIRMLASGYWIVAAFYFIVTAPTGFFGSRLFDEINMAAIGLLVLGIAKSIFDLFGDDKAHGERKASAVVTSVVLLVSTLWLFMASLIEWVVQGEPSLAIPGPLSNPCGLTTLAAVPVLAAIHLRNPLARCRVVSGCLWSLSLAILLAAILTADTSSRVVWTLFAIGLVVAIWGISWANRKKSFGVLNLLQVPVEGRLEASLASQLPAFSVMISIVVLLAVAGCVLNMSSRPLRYVSALAPFLLAWGLGCLSIGHQKRWLQSLSLAVATLGLVILGLSDASPAQLAGNKLGFANRILLVLAGAMFIHGALIARWVRQGDSWLKTLREAAVWTCFAAIAALILVVSIEALEFSAKRLVSLTIAESLGTAMVVLGMIGGLLLIAVRPIHDPFSFSERGRMGYVYAAEAVAALLLCHLYFTMPWLFQIGIKYYWPYIAIGISFAGVGVAHWLEKRQLGVLSQPIFNTAAIMPVLAAILIWSVDSKADPAAVLLISGLTYLMISYTHQSVLSGIMAIVLANLALWVFYDKFPAFAFVDHPQLWMIPPAVSILVAAQITAHSLSRNQLAMIRYVCVAVIYISSTSEIYISGIGERIWPPIVLAVLSIIGVMLGMMLQVRSFLLLGSIFLLMAMISMVSHAHQRLDHVWPWWAFGFAMGMAILAVFGWFESHRHKARDIAGRLRKWEL